jgi:hypothetical protein
MRISLNIASEELASERVYAHHKQQVITKVQQDLSFLQLAAEPI